MPELNTEPQTVYAPPDRDAALAAALAAAQGEFKPIVRNREVTVQPRDQSKRPYKFRYAPLDTILEAVRPALSKHGLATVQVIDGGFLKTIILHGGGGQLVAGEVPVAFAAGNPQQDGSELTYKRRYSLQMALGLAAEEDDDGNAASGNAASGNHAEFADVAPRKETAPPAPAPTAPQVAPQGDGTTVNGIAAARSIKDGGTAEKPWHKVSIKIGDNWYATFDAKLAERLMALAKDQTVELTYTTDAKGFRNIVSIADGLTVTAPTPTRQVPDPTSDAVDDSIPF